MGVPCEGSEARALEFGIEVGEEIFEGAFVGETSVLITELGLRVVWNWRRTSRRLASTEAFCMA